MSTALQKIDGAQLAKPALDRQVEAIARVLQQQTPKESIRWRVGKGGRQLAYASHTYVTQTLNDAFGWRWSFEIENEQILYVGEIPFEATCRGRLTVWLPGILEPIVKMQMGCQPIEMQKTGIKPVSLGDALKGAGSDALKKCASLLGIALDLYDSAHDARTNPTEAQLRATAEPVETDPNRIARDAQRPLESQLSPETRKALGEAMTVLHRELGLDLEQLQAEMQDRTGKTSRDKLTEDEGRGMLDVFRQMVEELRAEREASVMPNADEISF